MKRKTGTWPSIFSAAKQEKKMRGLMLGMLWKIQKTGESPQSLGMTEAGKQCAETGTRESTTVRNTDLDAFMRDKKTISKINKTVSILCYAVVSAKRKKTLKGNTIC